MRKLILLAMLAAGPAHAEDAQVRRACQADYVRLCAGRSAAGAAAAACLRQSYVSLGRRCRAALDAAKKPSLDPSQRQESRVLER